MIQGVEKGEREKKGDDGGVGRLGRWRRGARSEVWLEGFKSEVLLIIQQRVTRRTKIQFKPAGELNPKKSQSI